MFSRGRMGILVGMILSGCQRFCRRCQLRFLWKQGSVKTYVKLRLRRCILLQVNFGSISDL
jgi:hypothetical protein